MPRYFTPGDATIVVRNPDFVGELPAVPLRIPRYRNLPLMTRDDMVDLFRSDWDNSNTIRLDTVEMYIREHNPRFVGHLPPKVLGEVSEDMDFHDRMSVHRSNEEERDRSHTRRELFDLNGSPVFVPSWAYPSKNSTTEQNLRAIAKIESL